MASARDGHAGRMIGFIDVGTYSVRLLLVRLNPNQSYTTLAELKEPVRLGGHEYLSNRLQALAMDRAEQVCRRFAEMCRRSGAAEIVAVATSATREALNQREFLRRLRQHARLDVRVISGREEARLIYLGVSRGVHLAGRMGLFVDLGGGSTEISVGDERDYHYLDSLKLGTIRLTQMFQLDGPKAISAAQYNEVREYARSAAIRTIQQVRRHRHEVVIGTSGTIRNLAGMAALRAGRPTPTGEPWLTRAELAEVATELRRARLADRRRLPGLNPERADVIVAGAAILETLMDELGLKRIDTSRRGLRDGLLVDYLMRTAPRRERLYELAPRRRSVLLLGRLCGFDESHARRVAALALDLFDSAARAGLHRYGAAERELLEYAALLHDIGTFLSFVNHQAHTYYLIRHADLVGFDQTEIALVAALARYHRKGRPRPRDPELADLDARGVALVRRLFVLLRLAERLERSHHGVVRRARLRRVGKNLVALRLVAEGDCALELKAVAKDEKAFARAFGARLIVHARAASAGSPTATSRSRPRSAG